MRAVKEQTDTVKLDFEQEKEKKLLKENDSKYYQAIRKLKFQDHKEKNQEATQLKILKFKELHGNTGVEKAIETASKMC